MSSLTTHTGLKRSSVKSSDEQPKLKLTKEEQEILDGKMGPLLQKALKTIVAYGDLFRATELHSSRRGFLDRRRSRSGCEAR